MPVRPIRLRREWNSWAPISLLPPELMSLVFHHVRDAIAREYLRFSHQGAFVDPFEFYDIFTVKNWMQISHVCHAWREVAMNTASLWSSLVVTRSKYRWAEECLRRSKGSSLVLFADFPEGENDSISHHPPRTLLRELRNHIGRCRILSLRLTTGDLTDFLSQTDTSHLIQFHYSHVFDSDSSAGPRHSPPLIDDSFLRADSLRRLSISSCPIDWGASIFHHFTHLQLHTIPEESRLECHALVSFLVGMPRLEVLDLSNFLRMANSDASSGKAGGPRLQHLKHVELDDNPPALAGFLASLPIPPLCKILINVEGHIDTTAEEYLPILSWVSTRFSPPISGSPNTSDAHQIYWRSLRVFHVDSFIGFQGYTIEENLEPNEILFEHSIRLPDDSPINFCDILTLPQPLFTALPISRIVYLEIASYDWLTVLTESMWIDIFGSISTLETIRIDAKSLSFFQALLVLDSPFPVLSSVIVRDRNVNYSFILKSLHRRFLLGAALKSLVLEDCPRVQPSLLERLEMVVGKVEVINHDYHRIERERDLSGIL